MSGMAVGDPAYQFEDLSGPSWLGGRTIELRVVDTDQRPVAGAMVQVGSWEKSARLPALDRPRYPDRVAETDAEGRLRFELPGEFAVVVITHAHGVAFIDPEELFEHRGEWTAQIEPWAAVKGVLVDAQGRALPEETVELNLGRWTEHALNPLLDTHYRVTTDARGVFEFPRVPPGRLRIAHRMKASTGSSEKYRNVVRLGRSLVVHTEPSGTLETRLGGGGQMLRGRLQVETLDEAPIDLRNVLVRIVPRVESKGAPARLGKPDAFAAWTDEKRAAWHRARSRAHTTLNYDRWWAEANFERRALRHVDLKADGSFEVSDVAAGDYWFRASYPGMQSVEFPIDVVAADAGDVSIAAAIDLGTIRLSPRPSLAVGDVLPGFTATRLPVTEPPTIATWNQFKGRYVLLDFWATWCGPCVAELPHLQATAESFEGDERFVFVSVSLDKRAEPPTQYLEAMSPKGVHVWLSPEQATARSAAIPIPRIPSIWLIGPDGTILAQGLRGEQIMATVAAALAAEDRGG
ncbi:MAG: thioredoxin-like domain-containing protein [Planctomycetota bacterium]